MKKIALFTLALTAIFTSCQGIGGSSVATTPQEDSVSMCFGKLMGINLKQANGFNLNLDVFVKAFESTYTGGEELKPTELQEANAYVQNYMMNVIPIKLEEAEAKHIAELEKDTKLTKTESGLFYEIIAEGNIDKKPTADNTVKVHYNGTLMNGTSFDSSYERGEPSEFPLNGVIKGWTEGIQLVGEGGKIKLYIPSELAYGKRGNLGNQLLVFDVELLEIMESEAKK